MGRVLPTSLSELRRTSPPSLSELRSTSCRRADHRLGAGKSPGVGVGIGIEGSFGNSRAETQRTQSGAISRRVRGAQICWAQVGAEFHRAPNGFRRYGSPLPRPPRKKFPKPRTPPAELLTIHFTPRRGPSPPPPPPGQGASLPSRADHLTVRTHRPATFPAAPPPPHSNHRRVTCMRTAG